MTDTELRALPEIECATVPIAGALIAEGAIRLARTPESRSWPWLIHGIATFAPQIRAVYELADWYIWAGVGGTLLVALAIRYERRIRDLRRAVSSIGALR